jgi:glycerol-1-phosphate dehydrogenase [NAD(P)+]
MADWRAQMESLVAPAVARSATIREIAVSEGALADAPALVRRHFGDGPVHLIADSNTWRAAGETVAAALERDGLAVSTDILPAAPRPKPTVELATELRESVPEGATPVAVGSGVLNDLVKHAAFELQRPYLCVATAASMDGYSSTGAPLSEQGFKKTIPCRPPRAILADLHVIADAPREMAAWGYGDLAGKAPAGGDWLIADALGVEPLDDLAWPLVQDNLAGWLSDPAGVAAGGADATAALFMGLTLAGLAMELHGTSRPASGADHQIAHIWEMEGLAQDGERVAHGACVAIGALATLDLFDWALAQDFATLDADAILAAAPDEAAEEAAIDAAFPEGVIAARARAEAAAKRLSPEAHRARLADVAAAWPTLKARLEGHLIRGAEMRRLLAAAGAPVEAAEIGIDRARLRATVGAARFIRSRYTILDFLHETGTLDAALDAAFGPA